MKSTKMTFKLQMSDSDGVHTRSITSPVRLSKNDYEYRITFKEINEYPSRKLKVGESIIGRSIRDDYNSRCIITRIK